MDEKEVTLGRAWHPDGTPRTEGEEGYRSRVIPLVILHRPVLPEDARDQLWLAPQQRATQWLDLLYDLVIVAILTVFTSTHEVSSGESLLVYFSYFIIIWYIWSSQVSYDTRFQSSDWLHRLFKLVQLGAFAFVGVTARYFDPTNVIGPADVGGTNAVREEEGERAWRGVGVAYAVGRVCLVVQYVYVMWTTRKYKRHLYSLLIPALASLLSAMLWAISAALTETAAAKVTLGYLGLSIEYLSALLLPLSARYMKPPAATISERYGALTLIIIGEGIIGVIRSFSAVVAGFGFSTVAYAEAFCALVIVAAAWHFLFRGFGAEGRMGRKRGVAWLMLHMPLHLVILLLLSGMRNASTYSNISHALDLVSSNIDTLLDSLTSPSSSSSNFSSSAASDYLTLQLAKLNVQPSWPVEVQNLESEFLDPNNTGDPVVDLIQYETQVVVAIADFYYVHLSSDVLALRAQIAGLNATWDPELTDEERVEKYEADEALLDEFLVEYGTEVAKGVLFFLPCAGGLLVLASLLELLRSPPRGRWLWASFVLQLGVGVGLCFLGFLDIGNQRMEVDGEGEIAVYRALDANWILPIAAISYAGLIFADGVLMFFAQRAERRLPARSHGMAPVPGAEHESSEKHSSAAGSEDQGVGYLESGARMSEPEDRESSRVAQGSHHTLTP